MALQHLEEIFPLGRIDHAIGAGDVNLRPHPVALLLPVLPTSQGQGLGLEHELKLRLGPLPE